MKKSLEIQVEGMQVHYRLDYLHNILKERTLAEVEGLIQSRRCSDKHTNQMISWPVMVPWLHPTLLVQSQRTFVSELLRNCLGQQEQH